MLFFGIISTLFYVDYLESFDLEFYVPFNLLRLDEEFILWIFL